MIRRRVHQTKKKEKRRTKSYDTRSLPRGRLPAAKIWRPLLNEDSTVSATENVRGEGKSMWLRTSPRRDKETKIKRGTFDRKTRQRKTTPHRLLFFSFLETATGLNDARTHRATINVSRVWHFSSFQRGGGLFRLPEGGVKKGTRGTRTKGKDPQDVGDVTVRGGGGGGGGYDSQHDVQREREREKNNLRFE